MQFNQHYETLIKISYGKVPVKNSKLVVAFEELANVLDTKSEHKLRQIQYCTWKNVYPKKLLALHYYRICPIRQWSFVYISVRL